MPYWQENEIRFDVSSSYLATVTGESVLERVEPVEDTKANSGEAGCLIMTNLRLLWFSNKTAKLNLTIGYNTLVTITSQSAKNKKLNSTDALYLLAKVGNGRFEFLFTPLLENKTNYSVILNEIHKSYVASKPFRELRLRHHIIHANQLKVMPLEHICNRVEGVWNLANNQGNLGCFIITNVRVVWFATLNEYFNISLPYLQIAQFSLRDSKFGKVLVIESTENNGGRYLLGFRIDPASRLKQIFQEIQSLHLTQIRNPELGVSWNSISTRQTDALGPVQDEKEDEGVRCFTNYLQTDYMDSVSCGHPPEFDRTIGLAMEKLPSGVNRNTLWQIIF
ncbi:Bardet-Biedl syndrome 5 protein homolog [Daphnia pulicaria]|uniref:Bardet-Biedl syndrome 5 protein homolog n=1 Tax=Daphnia pulicaria TaxID=35523 RepID=UPI001EEC6AB9|nr:Bardet-Biedl syndrome 5 protein homolog [Daphnia pulicaria]